MKKALILLFLVLLIAALTVTAGCGGEKVEEEAEESKITVEQSEEGGQGGKVTIEGEEGETTYEIGEEKKPTEEELGVPIYPGAEYVPGSGVPAKVSTGSGEVILERVEFTTKQALNKVINWYKGKLGEPPGQEEGVTYWVYRSQTAETVMVEIKAEGSAVKITISKMSGEISPNQ